MANSTISSLRGLRPVVSTSRTAAVPTPLVLCFRICFGKRTASLPRFSKSGGGPETRKGKIKKIDVE
jgi:hypothetical protein